MAATMAAYSVVLCFDCFKKGVPSTAYLALFDAVATSCTIPLLLTVKRSRDPQRALMKVFLHFSIVFLCIIYWVTFAVFLYTGSMAGTSIFLIFIAAPIGFYFFNLFYGLLFNLVVFAGMIIYMWSPLHLKGYAFPDMYFVRLPLMYLVEVVVCALVQYETVKAQSRQELALIEAEQANKAKTDFLSNMSHEIRTPINAVLGMNEMISRDSLGAWEDLPEDRDRIKEVFADVSKYSQNIENAGNNLLSIINDILDFSKIEAGKLEIVEAEYRLSSVLNDVSNMIFFRTGDKGLDFKVDVDETIPDVLRGDEVRLRQIITNLLTNAVKYTKAGCVCLCVRPKAIPSDDDRRMIGLEIAVSDTGIGIKEEDISKLFTKFQRVNLLQNSTVEGTGLGLAITHNLLDMMGGEIKVESTYGEGSVFTVLIPQQVIENEPIGDFREKFETRMQSMHTYRESFHAPDARILIVDDTRMNLMVVVGLLKNTGMKVDTATGGAESVELATRVKYDVILMDQRMPEMDGTEAMERIRNEKDSLNVNTPFVCLTADAVSGAKERYLSEGFDDYLTKPIDSSALEKKLIKHLPEDKVVRCRVAETGTSNTKASEGTDEFDPLKKSGLDVESALKYASGDGGFYRSLLMEYILSSGDKKDRIQRFYDAGDWENYGIVVHSLKSTSRTIGAEDLAVSAAQLESAAKKGDIDLIRSENDRVLKRYEELLGILKTFMPEVQGKSDDGEEEIMEFLPEG